MVNTRGSHMQRSLSLLAPTEREDNYDWRTLALGIAAVLAHVPNHRHDSVTEVTRQLKGSVATLKAHAARLELQAADQSKDDTTREVAGRIVELADRMAECVAAILDLQRIRMGKLRLEMRQLDLVQLARECAARCQQPSPRVVAAHSATAPVLADRARLGQALATVIDRIVKSSTSGAVELRVGVREWSDGRPRLALTVGDVQPIVQEPRVGAQASGELELYVAREIVRLHGGELWVEQRGGGRGSSALLILPLDFSHGSHTVLAPGTACSRTA
jgi:signal transduction histidine kinase